MQSGSYVDDRRKDDDYDEDDDNDGEIDDRRFEEWIALPTIKCRPRSTPSPSPYLSSSVSLPAIIQRPDDALIGFQRGRSSRRTGDSVVNYGIVESFRPGTNTSITYQDLRLHTAGIVDNGTVGSFRPGTNTSVTYEDLPFQRPSSRLHTTTSSRPSSRLLTAALSCPTSRLHTAASSRPNSRLYTAASSCRPLSTPTRHLLSRQTASRRSGRPSSRPDTRARQTRWYKRKGGHQVLQLPGSLDGFVPEEDTFFKQKKMSKDFKKRLRGLRSLLDQYERVTSAALASSSPTKASSKSPGKNSSPSRSGFGGRGQDSTFNKTCAGVGGSPAGSANSPSKADVALMSEIGRKELQQQIEQERDALVEMFFEGVCVQVKKNTQAANPKPSKLMDRQTHTHTHTHTAETNKLIHKQENTLTHT